MFAAHWLSSSQSLGSVVVAANAAAPLPCTPSRRQWMAAINIAVVVLFVMLMRISVPQGSSWRAAGFAAPEEQLFCGISGGDRKWTKDALAAGASVHARNRQGITPLISAADTGDEEVVRRLMDAGAEVSARSDWGLTALAMAARAGHVSIMTLLLEAGAEVDQHAVQGGTALHWAAGTPHTDAITLLLAHGADVNARDAQGRTPLLLAVLRNGDVKSVQQLLDAGADVNAMDDDGFTALAIALAEGYDLLVGPLLAAGAKIDVP